MVQAMAIGLGALVVVGASFVAMSTRGADQTEGHIYWSDGDSGRLADGTRFRLHGVDAPETGSLRQRGGAKCEHERVLGYDAKAAVVELTRDGAITVSRDYGPDRYDRRVVDLSLGGEDLGLRLVAGGTHRIWDYDGGAPKPDWCGQDTPPRAAPLTP